MGDIGTERRWIEVLPASPPREEPAPAAPAAPAPDPEPAPTGS